MNILVSSCLLGTDCKYNGENNFNKKVSCLSDRHTVIPVCPEKLGGLLTPRSPAEIKNNRVITKDGKDVTDAFFKGAEIVLETAKKYDCKIAVLKANSPSCGHGKIYDGNFCKNLISGDGICAKMLIDNGIKVLTEDDDLDF